MNANTVIERYQTGRAGNHHTANSSCVLYLKADSTYGDTVFTDSSASAHTITNVAGVYHHIDDNRTADTALYFDGASKLFDYYNAEFDFGYGSYTIEHWVKITDTSVGRFTYNRGRGSGEPDDGFYYDHTNTRWSYSAWNGTTSGWSVLGDADPYVWSHVAAVYDAGENKVKMFINGVCTESVTPSVKWGALGFDSGNLIRLGMNETGVAFIGYMDGFRMTKGMPRYTSGIPTDGQSPHKQYDDGRSSNISSPTWATSSTRKFYGINTHTYLQTSEYSTNANTVLMIRGDDAETANDGVNMYGENGFHLEFKEVGAGTERDYNNFNTGAAGLGSDTSSTGEFADEATVLLLESRPNQANGSRQFINEVKQNSTTFSNSDDVHHNAAKSIFNADSNTANVSIASGGTSNY
jgi:hypothetical protein